MSKLDKFNFGNAESEVAYDGTTHVTSEAYRALNYFLGGKDTLAYEENSIREGQKRVAAAREELEKRMNALGDALSKHYGENPIPKIMDVPGGIIFIECEEDGWDIRFEPVGSYCDLYEIIKPTTTEEQS